MRVLGVILALTLSACTFSSASPLFDVSQAAQPFADGARFTWLEQPSGETINIVFRRDGALYSVESLEEPDEPMKGVAFIAIPETPEQDYIIQAQTNADDPSVSFAFMWARGDGFRLITAPSALGGDALSHAGAAWCEVKTFSECVFSRREDVLTLYRSAIYPRFVTGGATPQSHLELTPTSAPRDEK